MNRKEFEQKFRDGLADMPAIKNTANAFMFPVKGEVNRQPSLTVPDQSLSIRQIVEKYAQGMAYDGVKEAIYEAGMDEEDPPYFPDIWRMDLADREEILADAKSALDEVKRQADEKAAQRRKRSQQPKDAPKNDEITDIPFDDQPGEGDSSTNTP